MPNWHLQCVYTDRPIGIFRLRQARYWASDIKAGDLQYLNLDEIS